MIHWRVNCFHIAYLVIGLVINAQAHVPVALEKVPPVVLESVSVREPGIIIHEAAVDVSHSEIPVEGFVTTYVIKGISSRGIKLAVEVTSSGLVLQVYDREYYEEFIED